MLHPEPPDYAEQPTEKKIPQLITNTGMENEESENGRPSTRNEASGPGRNDFLLPHNEKVGYDDIFSEPDSIKKGELGKVMSSHMRDLLRNIFSFTQEGTYYVLSIMAGFFLSLVWGLTFGALNFTIVWILHPFLKIILILAKSMALCTESFTRIAIDPLWRSMSLMLSNISGNVQITLRDGSSSARRTLPTVKEEDDKSRLQVGLANV